jgi:hypothetical protein
VTPDDPPKPVPPLEITLEEWVAATQSCCGVELPDDPPEPPTTSE